MMEEGKGCDLDGSFSSQNIFYKVHLRLFFWHIVKMVEFSVLIFSHFFGNVYIFLCVPTVQFTTSGSFKRWFGSKQGGLYSTQFGVYVRLFLKMCFSLMKYDDFLKARKRLIWVTPQKFNIDTQNGLI